MLAIAGAVVPAARAEPPRLDVPVDCRMGSECFVQNHVDLAPGAEARDYTCGPLVYQGHKGTDFRVRSLREMADGVAVLAAAPGTVKAVRNGEPDISVLARGKQAVQGRECGNGVLLVHPDGWETQYCHLKRGSVAVAPGSAVAAGTKLAEIGLSGQSEFPHVHFEVRHRGTAVDPYTGLALEAGCETAPWTCGV